MGSGCGSPSRNSQSRDSRDSREATHRSSRETHNTHNDRKHERRNILPGECTDCTMANEIIGACVTGVAYGVDATLAGTARGIQADDASISTNTAQNADDACSSGVASFDSLLGDGHPVALVHKGHVLDSDQQCLQGVRRTGAVGCIQGSGFPGGQGGSRRDSENCLHRRAGEAMVLHFHDQRRQIREGAWPGGSGHSNTRSTPFRHAPLRAEICSQNGQVGCIDDLRGQSDRCDKTLHYSHSDSISDGADASGSAEQCGKAVLDKIILPEQLMQRRMQSSYKQLDSRDGRENGRTVIEKMWSAENGVNAGDDISHHPSFQSTQINPIAVHVSGQRESVRRQRKADDGCNFQVRASYQQELIGDGLLYRQVGLYNNSGGGVYHWPHKPTLVAAWDCTLPLHAKDVPFLSWVEADKFMMHASTVLKQPALFTMWIELTASVRDPNWVKYMVSNHNIETNWTDTQLSQDDINCLAEKSILREIPIFDVLGTCSSFTVIELLKQRRRWILWPKQLNAACIDEAGPDIPFPMVTVIIDRVRQYGKAITVDFTWFFRQFELDRLIALHMAIIKNGRAYIPTSVPTGGRHPPKFAHLLTSTLCKMIEFEFRDVDIAADGFVDNIRILGNDDCYIMSATNRLFELCKVIGITINESLDNCLPVRQYDFLGIKFDHSDHSVQLTEKSKGKLQWISDELQHDSIVLSVRDIQSIFGICVWCSTILACDKSSKYFVYKFYRRQCQGSTMDEVKMWPSIVGLWRSWVDELLGSASRIVKGPEDYGRHYEVFTDACLSGWGGIAYGPDGLETILGDSFTAAKQKKHINFLELVTVRFFFQRWVPQRAADVPISVRLHIDNTSSLGQLRRGYSSVFDYNSELQKLKHVLAHKNITLVEVVWVSTLQNPADHWSRLEQWTSMYFSPSSVTNEREREEMREQQPIQPSTVHPGWENNYSNQQAPPGYGEQNKTTEKQRRDEGAEICFPNASEWYYDEGVSM